MAPEENDMRQLHSLISMSPAWRSSDQRRLEAFLQNFRTILLPIVLLLLTVTPVLGSGGSECDYMACNSFFMPEIINRPQDARFFRGGLTFADKDPSVPNLDITNLAEWTRYFNGAIPSDELTLLVYKIPATDVAALAVSLDGTDVSPRPQQRGLQAALRRYSNKNRVHRALQYLILAKQVEPFAMANANRGWNSGPLAPPPDPTVVQALIDTAEQQLRGSDSFLTQRYRLQVMRLMYYARRLTEAQNYYERHKGTFNEENSPKYRFIDLAAGAYYKDKKFGKANYLFSLVYDKFQPLKYSSYFSFHPMEDSDWRETLSLTKTARE